ncbi:MAG: sulfur-carrier protein [Pseudonocardiales bacterium]|jgi:molybdopterin converting factor small subunit|nr:sulfur-carrier protein [Pseudonocardiales bacterium]MDT4920440.1 sulfur-carrier protein [Pseudonocardiales bacterium]
MPTIVLPAALRQYSGGLGSVDVEADGELELGAILDGLDAACPALARRVRDEQGQLRRYVNVYIDGEDARRIGGLSAPVPARAEVLVLPSVAGG